MKSRQESKIKLHYFTQLRQNSFRTTVVISVPSVVLLFRTNSVLLWAKEKDF